MEYNKQGPPPPGFVDPPPAYQQPPPVFNVGHGGPGATAPPRVVVVCGARCSAWSFYCQHCSYIGQLCTSVRLVLATMSMTNHPQRMTCPYCHADVLTEVRYTDGRMTHTWALVLCVLGCYCCCCIPYCIDDLKNVEHECPNCKRHIGTLKR